MTEPTAHRPKRADAARNEQTVLDATAEVFVRHGVDAPIRTIAAAAGVGMATIYRHFPTRADLIVAVYRHQVDACALAGPQLLATSATPREALTRWIALFVDFLVTKHGLAAAAQSNDEQYAALHQHFVTTLVPVCQQLLDAVAKDAEHPTQLDAYGLLRGIGNLCIGDDSDTRYQPRELVAILLDGLLRSSRPESSRRR
jgi:AcrR family transcriptional regulator